MKLLHAISGVTRLTAVTCAAAVLALATVEPAAAQAMEAPGFPPQIELGIPFAPTPFPNDGRTFLLYELYIRNFAAKPLSLQRIEVVDPDRAPGAPLAAFEGDALKGLLRNFGRPAADRELILELSPGDSMIAYVSVPLDRGAKVPRTLRHRVVAVDAAVEGAAVDVAQHEPRLFQPPVKGASWRLSGGPDNNSGHRRGMVLVDGRPMISRRYAIDFVQVENDATFAGDERDNRSYHAYGDEVLAVDDATVFAVRDGVQENVPGESPKAMPLDDLAGNFVTLGFGDGTYARYMHLKTGSVRVKAGDRVRRGQALGQVGNTGDSRQPHLHFDVSTGSGILDGEGVPYLIEEYWLTKSAGASPEHRRREMLLPERGVLVSFERPGGPAR